MDLSPRYPPPTADRYTEHAENGRRGFQGARRAARSRVLGRRRAAGQGDVVSDGRQGKDDETVVFSWITWPSRQVRDEGMKKVMADPTLQPDKNPMPFDGKRLIYGGFETLVDA